MLFCALAEKSENLLLHAQQSGNLLIKEKKQCGKPCSTKQQVKMPYDAIYAGSVA